MSVTSSIVVLYSGAYIFCPANAQHPFIINIGIIVVTQIVMKPPIAFIRTC
jgi:hypothetical protein